MILTKADLFSSGGWAGGGAGAGGDTVYQADPEIHRETQMTQNNQNNLEAEQS